MIFWFLCVCVYAPTHVVLLHICACIHLCICVWKSEVECIPQLIPNLSEIELIGLASLTGQEVPGSFRPLPPVPALECRWVLLCLAFYTGTGDLNSSPVLAEKASHQLSHCCSPNLLFSIHFFLVCVGSLGVLKRKAWQNRICSRLGYWS